MRVRPEVASLRTKARARVIRQAFVACCARDGFRIIDWTIQGNHLHLVAEADGNAELSRGMQAFSIRVARGLNRLAGRTGAVFTERYHIHVLTTPAEVRNARAYVLNNFRRHAAQGGRRIAAGEVDPYSSWGWRRRDAERSREGPAAAAQPESWLLRVGWRRRGLVSVSETPSSCDSVKA